MKTNKRLILDIILGLALFYAVINIFAVATTTVQSFSSKLSNLIGVSKSYLKFIRPIAAIGTLFFTMSIVLCILNIFIFKNKYCKFLAIFGQCIDMLVLLIFSIISKLKTNNYADYEYSNVMQAMFVTLFALSFILLAINLIKMFCKDKENDKPAV